MSESTEIKKLAELVANLMQEIADLRQGIPFHTHRCGDHTWRCTSPYCFAIEQRCLSCDPEAGGPIGGPPAYEPGQRRYLRQAVTNV